MPHEHKDKRVGERHEHGLVVVTTRCELCGRFAKHIEDDSGLPSNLLARLAAVLFLVKPEVAMSLTQLAVLLTGVWMLLLALAEVSETLTIVFGIVVIVLVLLDAPAVRARSRV